MDILTNELRFLGHEVRLKLVVLTGQDGDLFPTPGCLHQVWVNLSILNKLRQRHRKPRVQGHDRQEL